MRKCSGRNKFGIAVNLGEIKSKKIQTEYYINNNDYYQKGSFKYQIAEFEYQNQKKCLHKKNGDQLKLGTGQCFINILGIHFQIIRNQIEQNAYTDKTEKFLVH